jgi:hypothetical protein
LPCLIGSRASQREHSNGDRQASPANTESLPSRAAVAPCRLLARSTRLMRSIRVSRARV